MRMELESICKTSARGLSAGLLGLALLNGCTPQNHNIKDIGKINIVSESEKEQYKDMGYISNKLPSDWKVRTPYYTQYGFLGAVEKGHIKAVLDVIKFEDEKKAAEYLTKKAISQGRANIKKNHIELSYKTKGKMIGDVIFTGTTKNYEIITRSDNCIFEISCIDPNKKEKQELRKLLYSIVQ